MSRVADAHGEDAALRARRVGHVDQLVPERCEERNEGGEQRSASDARERSKVVLLALLVPLARHTAPLLEAQKVDHRHLQLRDDRVDLADALVPRELARPPATNT